MSDTDNLLLRERATHEKMASIFFCVCYIVDRHSGVKRVGFFLCRTVSWFVFESFLFSTKITNNTHLVLTSSVHLSYFDSLIIKNANYILLHSQYITCNV